jgi:hypothetical protein
MDCSVNCILPKNHFMRKTIFTAFVIGLSIIGNAQEKVKDTTKVRFDPPIIVKDEETKVDPKEVTKFTPPVIVKDKPTKAKKPKRKEAVKFKPPVIVKD